MNSKMKPILFNTDMVRALLEGRKTVTRRPVKNKGGSPADYGRKHYSGLRYELNGDVSNLWAGFYMDSDIFYVAGEKHIDAIYFKAPYRPGDILYVRETWSIKTDDDCIANKSHKCPYKSCENHAGPCVEEVYIYKASDILPDSGCRWHPSIHMPREAARIFLRVTGVWVERLWDVNEEKAITEGASNTFWHQEPFHTARQHFISIWDNTIKPADRKKYGWSADPWVWVITFERISKEEAYRGEP